MPRALRTLLAALALVAGTARAQDADEVARQLDELASAAEALALQADGRPAEALAALAAVPTSESARVARARLDEGASPSSLEQDPARLDPDGPWAALSAARVLTGVRAESWEAALVRGRFFRVTSDGQDPLPAEARALLAPWLVEHPGSLVVWDALLGAPLRSADPADRTAARRAAEAAPDAPYAPAVLVHVAKAERDLDARVDLLERALALAPAGPFADDAVFELAIMDADGARPDAAIARLVPLVESGAGERWARAARALARLYVDDGRHGEALDVLDRLEARGEPEMRLHVAALREAGRLEEAADRCRAWLRALEAADAGATARAPARWALGELELRLGRPAEALALFDAVDEELGGSTWGLPDDAMRSRITALVRTYPFPVSATALHYLMMATFAGLCAVAVAGRARRVRPYLAASAAVALVVAAMQLASIAVGPETLTLRNAGYVAAAVVRNALYAGAGLVLLPRAVARRGALLRALRGRPEPARLVSTAVWVAGAIAVMWGATRGMFEVAELVGASPGTNAFFERSLRFVRDSELALLLEPADNRLEYALFVATAAVQEELLFRFAMLGVFLAGLRRLAAPRGLSAALAVLLASVLFAVPHAGMVDPEWFKMVQVSLLGCVLGYLCLRRGPGAAVVAHAAFNLSTLLFIGSE